MTYPLAGGIIYAADISALLPIVREKTADESVSASTAMQNDDHLVWPVEANSTYVFLLSLQMISGANAGPDFKYDFTGPSGVSIRWGSIGLSNALASGSAGTMEANTQAGVTSLGTSTTATSALIHGKVVTAGTAGNLQFRWAQLSASSVTTVGIASWGLILKTA